MERTKITMFQAHMQQNLPEDISLISGWYIYFIYFLTDCKHTFTAPLQQKRDFTTRKTERNEKKREADPMPWSNGTYLMSD